MATRKLRITESVLLGISFGRYEVIANPLPLDVVIVASDLDGNGVIHLLLESSEFSESDGGPTPEWPAPIIRRLAAEPERPRIYESRLRTSKSIGRLNDPTLLPLDPISKAPAASAEERSSGSSSWCRRSNRRRVGGSAWIDQLLRTRRSAKRNASRS
jgi:hypothetical protein